MSLAYEGILLFALLFVASYLFLGIARDAQAGLPRAIFQIYLLLICGVYFMFCWTRTGQTLAMKTWRMRVVTQDGQALNVWRALRRFILATPGTLTGVGLVWAIFDRERQFLHDRLAGTRIVQVSSELRLVNGDR